MESVKEVMRGDLGGSGRAMFTEQREKNKEELSLNSDLTMIRGANQSPKAKRAGRLGGKMYREEGKKEYYKVLTVVPI